MKKVVVAIVILAVIVTAGILESVYVTRVFKEVDGKLADIESSIRLESEDALQKTRALISWWNERRQYMELFVYSPDVRAFSVALGEAEGSLMCGDFQNALSKTQSLMVMSNNIRRILDFNLEDII